MASPKARADQPIVLLVDDEPSVVESLTILCKRQLNVQVRSAHSPADAIDLLDRVQPDAVVTDLSMDGRENAGIDVLEACRRRHPDVPVFLMSAVASRDTLVLALNARATGFFEKPFKNHEMVQRLRDALTAVATRRTAVADARTEAMAEAPSAGRLIGSSPAFRECRRLVELAAPSQSTVLFEGESGVGKSLLAEYLHQCSPRAAGPFIPVNCGAFTETLLESQLFGHVKGAFTGSVRDEPGFVRAADGGTLFLDEIGELTQASQVRLLRVLQDREVTPVGGTEAFPVDVRFVAATNADLKKRVAAGTFREDLFWRLHVMALLVPPLRDRPEDIPLIARDCLARLRKRDASVTATDFTPEALAVLSQHTWPGNVRELANAIERASILCRGTALDVDDLQLAGPGAAASSDTALPSVLGTARVTDGALPALTVVERAYVQYVLRERKGDLVAAADVLGIPVAAVRAFVDS